MNAARDTPALFYVVKAYIGATSPVGEILWRATNYKTQIIRTVLI
ncbi:hypothetical protein [uncultured Campylobacter sp.]|nr:hypothetical protein [uncultured Campylobacter sp.]